MRKNYFIQIFSPVFLIFFFLSFLQIFPCTVAVVSGNATPDGRPLLWKNRDTKYLKNKVVFLKGPKHDFIGIINASDKKAINIWAGINTQGLAIINSASPDLILKDQKDEGNGKFMKLVLGTCDSVDEVEALLKKTNGRRAIAANFGVIDAEGNACLFETSSQNYIKFDANDPRVAPQGFIVRTNYAFTASPNKGGGYIRFNRAQKLFTRAAAKNGLDYRFILREVSRDLVNEKVCSYPFSSQFNNFCSEDIYIHTNDTINRYTTASVTVFHGVKPDENPLLSTMWVILGAPICGVAVPLWAAAGFIPQELSGSELAPFNQFSLILALYLYPEQRGNNKQYLNITRLKNYREKGVLPLLFEIEAQVFKRTQKILSEWRKKLPDKEEMASYEKEVCRLVKESLKINFPTIDFSEN
ncbi:MAG: carcinine hydrolase/isopenicillin-N N-acyltransferase family protein [Candidatus Aminicenantia bacterium]